MSPLIAQHHHGVLPHGTKELTTTVFQGLYVASRVTPHPQCPPAFLHRGRLLYIIHKCVHPFCGLFILLAYFVYSNIHFGSFFHFPFLILQIFYLFFDLFSGNFIVEYKILRSYLLPSLQLLGSSSQLHIFGFVWLFFIWFGFWDKGSLHSPGWPGIGSADQASIKCRNLPACLCLLNAGIKSACRHTRLHVYFY